MNNKFYHSKIGHCVHVIDAEINYENGTKYFTLVKSYHTPKYDKNDRFVGFHLPIRYGSKLQYRHYVLWGNTPNYDDMGITLLTTPTGKPVRGGKPMKIFFEFIRSAKNMQFTKTNKHG